MSDKSEHMQRVEQFMRLARQATPGKPAMPDEKVRWLRASLILEEAFETVRALGFSPTSQYDQTTVKEFTVVPDEMDITFEPIEPDLAEIADGCADLSVVNIGTLIACGIPDAPLLKLVDDNNLAKFAPGHSWREDGKLIKPLGHRPPDIAGLLAKLQQPPVDRVDPAIRQWSGYEGDLGIVWRCDRCGYMTAPTKNTPPPGKCKCGM